MEQLWTERERQDEEIEKVWRRWIVSRPTILPCLQAVEDEKQKLVDEAASEVAAMAKCVEEASRLEAEAGASLQGFFRILYSFCTLVRAMIKKIKTKEKWQVSKF